MTFTPAQTRTLGWLAIGAALAFLLWLLGPVLAPFVVALVLGYALQPLVTALVRRRWPRWLAVTLVEAVALLLAVALVLLLLPILAKNLPQLLEQAPTALNRLAVWLQPWLARWDIVLDLDFNHLRESIVGYLSDNTETFARRALSSLRIGGSYVLGFVGTAVLIPLVLFYLLMDWPRFIESARQLVPPRLRPQVEGFVVECDHMLGQYLRGQALVMGVLAVFYSVGLALFRFEMAVPVGVFTGLAVFIPYLGFGLGLILALLAGVLQFGSVYAVVAVAVVYGLGQVLESFWLTPRLVGERIGMHPVTVIFALLAFGQLFGFVGVLVALPVCAVGVVAWRRMTALYRESALYRG
ncbi:MAG TPA: AI-2E family transporter [Methylibium sp.]|uniref:AI-2E family transporter n=1 Tax=Methylibium sp. TaxID=2067992 RepID=UPI002DB5F882|nr:AI-2E family transporter [Methylibium sp.]HEU4459357.1 AI-2E family transporter [Methylibium sp.]